MAISNLDALASSLGLESGKLQEMISSEEEHSLPLDNFVIDTKENFGAREENIKKEARQAGLEIAIKNARNELGLEFEGKKDLTPLLTAYKAKIESEATIEPNEKYDSLKKDFEALQNISKDWETKYNNLDSEYKKKDQQRTINSSLLKAIPENTTISREDVLSLIKSKNDFQIGDNGVEWMKNGEVQKNTNTLNPLGVEEFMKDLVKPYLKPVEGGAGGDDSKKGGQATSLDVFNERMEKQSIKMGSAQYNEEMSKAINNGSLKF